MDYSYEKNLIINNRELRYSGILRVDELFQRINRALEERGYQKREKKTEEVVTEAGRRTYIELRPRKVKSNYAQFGIKIKITLDHITEVVEEVQGVKKKFQRGDLLLVFDAWILTDYENRWSMKPLAYFLKGIINKYLYTFPLEAGFPGELVGDTAYIYAQVQKLLQSYNPTVVKVAKEADIVKEMEKQVLAEDMEE